MERISDRSLPARRLLVWSLARAHFVGYGLVILAAAIPTFALLVAVVRASPVVLLILFLALFLQARKLRLRHVDPLRPPPLQQAEEGEPVAEEEEPQLFALIREAAAQVGAPMPDEVLLVPGVRIFSVRTERGRTLLGIGVGLLECLRLDELRALVLHPLAALAHRHGQLRGVVNRTLEAQEALVERLGPGWRSAPVRAHQRLLLRAWSDVEGRLQAQADETAAAAAGGSLFASGLGKLVVGAGVWEQFLAEEVQPLLEEGFVPHDLYAGFRLCLLELEARGELERLAALHREDAADDADSVGARLARLAALGGQAPREDAPPARSILADPDATGRRAAAAMRIHLDASEGTPFRLITWDEVAEQVWAPRFERAAQALREAMPPGDGLDRLLTWLAGPSRFALAAAAWPSLLEGEETGEARHARAARLLANGVAGWIAGDLVALGWRWETRPASPLVLVAPGGEAIAPLALGRAAVEAPEAVADLRERLLELGLLGGRVQRTAPARALLH